MMDRPAFLVGLDDPLGDRGDRLFEPCIRGHATESPRLLVFAGTKYLRFRNLMTS